jgi:hypothetical protein
MLSKETFVERRSAKQNRIMIADRRYRNTINLTGLHKTERYQEYDFNQLFEKAKNNETYNSVINDEGVTSPAILETEYKRLQKETTETLSFEEQLVNFENTFLRLGYGTPGVIQLWDETFTLLLLTYVKGGRILHLNISQRNHQRVMEEYLKKEKPGVKLRKHIVRSYIRLSCHPKLTNKIKKCYKHYENIGEVQAQSGGLVDVALFTFIMMLTISGAFITKEMVKLLKTTTRNINAVSFGAQGTLGQATNTLASVSNITNGVASLSSGVGDVLLRLKNSLIDFFVWTKNHVTNALQTVMNYKKEAMALIFVALIVLLLKKIPQSARELIWTTFAAYCKQEDIPTAQAFSPVAPFYTFYSVVTGGAAPPAFLKNFNFLSSFLVNLAAFFKVLEKYGKTMLNYVYKKMYGEHLFESLSRRESFEEGIQILISRCDDYAVNSTLDIKSCSEVIDLYPFVRSYYYTTARSDRDVSRIQPLMTKFHALYEKAMSITVNLKSRVEPVGIFLTGKPGVGKSVLSNALANWVQQLEEVQPSSSNVFQRKFVNEYWDGYNGQMVTVYDDFLQALEPTKRTEESLELIHAINTVPFQLHMANVEAKLGTYFKSDYVICTANHHTKRYLPGDLGLTDWNALYRRLHLKLYVGLKENIPVKTLEDVDKRYTFKVINLDGKLCETLTIAQVLDRIKMLRLSHLQVNTVVRDMADLKVYSQVKSDEDEDSTQSGDSDSEESDTGPKKIVVKTPVTKWQPKKQPITSRYSAVELLRLQKILDKEEITPLVRGATQDTIFEIAYLIDTILNGPKKNITTMSKEMTYEEFVMMRYPSIEQKKRGPYQYMALYYHLKKLYNEYKEKGESVLLEQVTKKGITPDSTVVLTTELEFLPSETDEVNSSAGVLFEDSPMRALDSTDNDADNNSSSAPSITIPVYTEQLGKMYLKLNNKYKSMLSNFTETEETSRGLLKYFKSTFGHWRTKEEIPPVPPFINNSLPSSGSVPTPADPDEVELIDFLLEVNSIKVKDGARSEIHKKFVAYIFHLLSLETFIPRQALEAFLKGGAVSMDSYLESTWDLEKRTHNLDLTYITGPVWFVKYAKMILDQGQMKHSNSVNHSLVGLWVRKEFLACSLRTDASRFVQKLIVMNYFQNVRQLFKDGSKHSKLLTHYVLCSKIVPVKEYYYMKFTERTGDFTNEESFLSNLIEGTRQDLRIKVAKASARVASGSPDTHDFLLSSYETSFSRQMNSHPDLKLTSMDYGIILSLSLLGAVGFYYLWNLVESKFSPIAESLTPRDQKKINRALIKRTQGRRKMVKNAKIPAQSLNTVTSILPRVANNCEYVNITNGNSAKQQFLTFIRPNVAVTPYHSFKDGFDDIFFYWGRVDSDDGGFWVKKADIKLDVLSNDLCKLTFLNGCLPMRKDMIRHVPEQMIDNTGPLYRLDFSQDGTFFLDKGTGLKVVQDLVTRNTDGTVNEIPVSYKVSGIVGKPSDCGLPYFNINSQKTIAAIHIAGLGRDSYASPLLAEYFIDEEDCEPGSQSYSIGDPVSPPDYDYQYEDEPKLVKKGLLRIGKIGKPVKTNLDNDIRPSIVQQGTHHLDKDYPCPYVPTKKPVRLKDYHKKQEDGYLVKISPMENSLKSFEKKMSPPIPEGAYHRELFNGVFHSKFNWDNIRKLSLEEAVFGEEGSDFLGPLDFSASSGWGYCDRGISMDKLFPIKNGVRTISDNFRKHVELEQLMVDSGILPPHVAIGSFKSEIRPLEKENNPRFFCNGNKTHMVRSKMWLGRLIQEIVRNDGEGDVFIGQNPYDYCWTHMAKKFPDSSRIIATDGSKWDLCFRYWFSDIFVKELRLQLKENTNWNSLEREKFLYNVEAILVTTLNPRFILGTEVFVYQGMPSGSWLTASLNSIYNSWMTRFLFFKGTGILDFDSVAVCRVMGDDNITSVQSGVDYDATTHVKLAKRYFNLDMTSAAKDGKLRPFQDLFVSSWDPNAAQFLKRQWRVENGNVYPILDPETLTNMVLWIKSDTIPENILTRQLIETALREWALHGKELYNYHYDKLIPFYRASDGGKLPFTYEQLIMGFTSY